MQIFLNCHLAVFLHGPLKLKSGLYLLLYKSLYDLTNPIGRDLISVLVLTNALGRNLISVFGLTDPLDCRLISALVFTSHIKFHIILLILVAPFLTAPGCFCLAYSSCYSPYS